MKHPDYQLRPNKAVDRLLLVDVIRKLAPTGAGYTYYGLGGPFLEDLRIMDHFFPDMKLVSIESNLQTYKRQNFNQFSRRLDLRHKTLRELMDDFSESSKVVFWLDYTDLKLSRLTDFQTVLTSVKPGSIVRLTVRANPDINFSSLEDKFDSTEIQRVKKILKESLKTEFYEYLDQIDNDEKLFLPANYAEMVQLMIKRVSIGVKALMKDVEYLPIQSIRYSDGTQMLSVTGIVCRTDEIEATREKLKHIRFANLDWDKPVPIDMPALSMKERLHLEKHLPIAPDSETNAGEVLFNELKYCIDEGEKRTKDKLNHYAECEREFPNFIRTLG